MKKNTGILTSGLFLIFVGILLTLENFSISLPYLIYQVIWPCFFISLGLELLLSKKLYGEENSAVNVAIILLTILILLFTSEIFYLPTLNFEIW
jgi:hypothetical protein